MNIDQQRQEDFGNSKTWFKSQVSVEAVPFSDPSFLILEMGIIITQL